jgi:hypothetical protein
MLGDEHPSTSALRAYAQDERVFFFPRAVIAAQVS